MKRIEKKDSSVNVVRSSGNVVMLQAVLGVQEAKIVTPLGSFLLLFL